MKLSHVILAVTATLSAGTALARDPAFTMVNKTGYAIREVYISPAKKDNWGRDRLGSESTLDNNRSRHFRFRDQASCRQDIKAVFDDKRGTSVTWTDIDLCKVNKLTLKYDRYTRKVSAIRE
jgi:hypothetical protein